MEQASVQVPTATRKAYRPRNAIERFFFQIWKARTSYVMLAPFFFLFSMFVLYPIGRSAYLSMTDYRGANAGKPNFIGFDNYRDILRVDMAEIPQARDEDTDELLYTCEFAESPEDMCALDEATNAPTSPDCTPELAAVCGVDDAPRYCKKGKKVPESELSVFENAGGDCSALMEVDPRNIVPGFPDNEKVTLFGKKYMIGMTDRDFWIAIVNTVKYAFVTVFLSTVMGLLLALVLQRQHPVNMVLRVIFFLPSVTSTIAVAVVWRWILNSENYGLINGILNRSGMDTITFLNDPSWTLLLLILMAAWGGMGYNMILFLAGLQNISQDMYEAAAIDGANRFQAFRRITLPMLRPTMLYVVAMGTITAFQVFDSVYVIFRSVEGIGGIRKSGLTVVPYLYDKGFNQIYLGYASAIAWILFILIFILTMINLRVGRSADVS